MSGTRDVRSAIQPKIGSPMSRAAGHAAITNPSSSRSTPCSVKYSGMIGRSAPKPSQTISSAANRGRTLPHWSSQAATRDRIRGRVARMGQEALVTGGAAGS
jgi:hypothetical protein